MAQLIHELEDLVHEQFMNVISMNSPWTQRQSSWTHCNSRHSGECLRVSMSLRHFSGQKLMKNKTLWNFFEQFMNSRSFVGFQIQISFSLISVCTEKRNLSLCVLYMYIYEYICIYNYIMSMYMQNTLVSKARFPCWNQQT